MVDLAMAMSGLLRSVRGAALEDQSRRMAGPGPASHHTRQVGEMEDGSGRHFVMGVDTLAADADWTLG